MRCQWCGVFVASGTRWTRWRSQNADLEWREHEAILCPTRHESASTESPWWKPEVQR